MSFIVEIFACDINIWKYKKEEKDFEFKQYKSIDKEITFVIHMLYDNRNKIQKFDILSNNIINKKKEYCCNSCILKKY